MRIGGRRFLLSLAIIGASVCLALGISLPIIKLTSFVFWSSQHSLLSTVEVLLLQGQWFLGLTVLIFSIVFPVLKLLYLLLISTLPNEEIVRQHWRLRALEWLGKWSMHDVLVLALMIFFIKSQGVYDASSLNGVYFFTAAIVLMILAYAWLPHVAQDAVRRAKVKADAAKGGSAANPAPASPPEPPDPFGVDAVEPETPARKKPFRNFVLSFFIILATVFFALGVILPVIRFTTVYVWSAEHSIVTIIWALYENGELFLCAVLFIFSILFPFLKLFYLLTLVTSPDLSPEFREKSISTMEWLGRYSMTDVMVLALMIFYVNSSGYTEAVVQPGVYFFAASALMTMLAYGWANTTAPRSVVVAARNAAHAGGLGETAR
ncbi:MAG: paraquat-inducible protein A [Alphaproteobacteria bacterium]|nr:paraquat-inducible protein A [Alphaproteobacteria bacterium]